jgi:flavin-dependent dehydrogenase
LSYDIIIAGASFAGLTMASRIKGKILLIDRKSVGSLPTSACATFYDVLKKMGCENSLLKVLNKVNWQTAYNSYIYEAVEPFCTFDYKEFCQRLFSKFNGEFLKANIKGYQDGSVVTDKGVFSARAIVDCTGWRATLASSIKSNFVDDKTLFFAVETVTSYEDDKLNFFMDPNINKGGYAWIFPIDKGSRFGLGCFAKEKHNLIGKLRNFTSSFGVKMGGVHGGFIPFKLRQAVVDRIFLVGDSAGHAFPLTAEGIRQCIYFAQECAEIIQKIIDNGLSLEDGLKAYQNFAKKHSWVFTRLSLTQNCVLNATNRRLDLASKLCCRRWPINFIQRGYFNAMKIKPQ